MTLNADGGILCVGYDPNYALLREYFPVPPRANAVSARAEP